MRVLFLLVLAGCTGTEYPPPDPLPDGLQTCTVSEDCVVVELGCCDHCNGGVAVAVRADAAAEVEDQYAERCRRRTACTLIGCPNVSAECGGDGMCELVQDTDF